MKDALYILGNIVHHLQRERGCAAVYLYSKGSLFSQRLELQINHSNNTINLLMENWGHWKKTKNLTHTTLLKIERILDNLQNISIYRDQVLNREIIAASPLDYYTFQLISPLLQTVVEIALSIDEIDPNHVSALNAFLQWKERIGLERVVGAQGLIQGDIKNPEFIRHFNYLLSEQNNYKKSFIALATKAQKELTEKMLEDEKCYELETIHASLQSSENSNILIGLTPQSWFDLVSAKIHILHVIERKLIDVLFDEDEALSRPRLSLNGTLKTDKGVKSFGEYDELIASLQIFANLSPKALQPILQHAQLKNLEKGNLLFLEGEQANRFYIILKGWVKIFKSTSSGEETTLQMLSASESIMESAVFLNTSYPVNGQAAEECALLSLPAPIIREQIKSNTQFAQNLLASMSYRSQGLIRQIENGRLKTADERIGWYLLTLMLAQGSAASRAIELPYDKATIASYLDMKRETFSRALQRMKTRGFKIENDKIILPQLNALCGFCDIDIARSCKFYGSENCSNANCLDKDHHAPIGSDQLAVFKL